MFRIRKYPSGPADIGKIVNIVIGALVIATIPVVFESYLAGLACPIRREELKEPCLEPRLTCSHLDKIFKFINNGIGSCRCLISSRSASHITVCDARHTSKC